MSAHYGNHYLDDEMFRPMFKRINELKLPVYVHHTPLPVDYASILAYDNLRRSFGRCQDQVTAIGRELFSGMFAELPDVKMVHSMLGADHIIYGSSYPVKQVWMTGGPEHVRQLDIREEEKELLLAGNARRIYGVDGYAEK